MINILMSWPYLNTSSVKTWEGYQETIRMLVDSGAFSNWKAGVETSVDEYMAFIKGLPVKPWRYFSLDKIGDPEVTRCNYQTMLDKGLRPVPVFTRGADIADLDKLYDHSDVVGVGVGVGSNNYRGYLKWVVEQNQGRRLHWLGVTAPNLVGHYRPYSCDASSWEAGGRYGIVNVYMGGGQFKRFTRGDARHKPPTPEMWNVIRSLGFNPRSLQHEAHWRGGESVSRRVGCGSTVRYALDVERRYLTKMFLATTTSQGLRQCVGAYRHELGRTDL